MEANGHFDWNQRVALYKQFDSARQNDLEELAEQYATVTAQLKTVRGDLEDEQHTRRQWRQRAEVAESSLNRNQFVAVLVDGDGYIFKDAFLRDASGAGGARAAHELDNEVQQYLRMNNMIDSPGSDIQVLITVIANRAGLSKTLCGAEVLQNQGQLDQFFCSFTQSQSLFQFIDCGSGKERADAKLRDYYRFYMYNAQCKHVFLACCHDTGYIAELDKYRHDPSALAKTVLVYGAQSSRYYSSLPFPVTRFPAVFENEPLQVHKRTPLTNLPEINKVSQEPDITPKISNVSSVPATWSSLVTSPAPSAATLNKQVRPSTTERAETPKGIAVNQYGQRIDLKMRIPTTLEINDFEQRIKNKKLCNRYHLSGDCANDNRCVFDHGVIDASMKNTLRYKARSIPCSQGQYCRQMDCYYGHQCPWGQEKCANSKCAFSAKDMHNVKDLEVAKFVPAEAW